MPVLENTNKIFLACNYSNKKIKQHFNILKSKLEGRLPIRVVLIDKERHNASRDIWQQIQNEISSCALGIFDVSAFRPNVVLELGYCLAIKGEGQILITFDHRKPKGARSPEWLLSDITHLHRVQYKTIDQLDEKIEEHLNALPFIQNFEEYCNRVQETRIPEKYKSAALSVFKQLQTQAGLTDSQIEFAMKGTNVNKKYFLARIKEYQLARRDRGRGRWHLVDS